MPVVNKSALVMFSAAQMYDLVKDIDNYQVFLPWCADSTKLSETDKQVCGQLTVSRMGISQTFSTCNQLFPVERIAIELKEGPFSELKGEWVFTALREDACKIELNLTFNFSGKLINAAFGQVFYQIANTMVDSFCQRARDLYDA